MINQEGKKSWVEIIVNAPKMRTREHATDSRFEQKQKFIISKQEQAQRADAMVVGLRFLVSLERTAEEKGPVTARFVDLVKQIIDKLRKQAPKEEINDLISRIRRLAFANEKLQGFVNDFDIAFGKEKKTNSKKLGLSQKEKRQMRLKQTIESPASGIQEAETRQIFVPDVQEAKTVKISTQTKPEKTEANWIKDGKKAAEAARIQVENVRAQQQIARTTSLFDLSVCVQRLFQAGMVLRGSENEYSKDLGNSQDVVYYLRKFDQVEFLTPVMRDIVRELREEQQKFRFALSPALVKKIVSTGVSVISGNVTRMFGLRNVFKKLLIEKVLEDKVFQRIVVKIKKEDRKPIFWRKK